MKEVIKAFISGKYWKKKWSDILKSLMAYLGTYFLLVRTIEHFGGEEIVKKYKNIWLLLVIIIVIALYRNREKLTYSYFIENKDIKIKLIVGDIFKEKGDKVITTNTTFDTKMEGRFISEESLQGQLYLKYYKELEELDSVIEKKLSKETYIDLKRENSKSKRYKIGTTIKLSHRDFCTYWVALANINESGKPINCCLEDLQNSLVSLWNHVLTQGHMEKLVIPIMGSGKTTLNESREKIIKEIIVSFVSMSKENKITEELIICISPKDYHEKNFDFEMIKKFLEYQCLYRHTGAEKIRSSSIGESMSGRPS